MSRGLTSLAGGDVGQGPHAAGPSALRIAGPHAPHYIYMGINGPNGDLYLYAHTQVDAQVFGFYQGSPQYPIQREFYNRTISLGVRLTR
jgi:hypothetical protein